MSKRPWHHVGQGNLTAVVLAIQDAAKASSLPLHALVVENLGRLNLDVLYTRFVVFLVRNVAKRCTLMILDRKLTLTDVPST
jgi:hypothetical protein